MEKMQKDILQEEGQNKHVRIISETVLACILLSGFLFSFKDLTYSGSCVIAALLSGIAVILFFQKVGQHKKTLEKVHKVFYIVCVAFSIVTGIFLIQGFLYAVNLFIQLWNLRFNTEIVQFSTGTGAGLGSLLLWVLIGMIMGNILLGQIKKRRMGFPLLFITIAAAFSNILGQSNIWMEMLLLLVSVFGLFIFYSVPERRLGIYGIGCIGVAFIFVAALTLISSGYKKSVNIERYKYNIAKQIEKIRYGEDSLPQGNFRSASKLLRGNEERLELKINTPQELYLKGFVGAEYNKTHWNTLSLENYTEEYGGMLTWLEKNDFLPITQYSSYNELSKKASGEEAQYQNVSVTNKKAYRKYVYLPSVLTSWEEGKTKVNKDWNVYSTAFFGARNYDFKMVDQVSYADMLYADAWTQKPTGQEQQKYSNTESIYHSFVEDSYLTVGREQRQLIEDMFFKKEQETKDFTEVTSQIRQVLRSEMNYTKTPQVMPEGEDFLQWFLKEKNPGNAVAFATAAVMAYRTAGYPARYVEGYHLSTAEAKSLSEQNKKEVTLTTQNAHAWVEVYVMGIGWMPVEVVPGLYTETYTNETVEGKPAYKINSKSDKNGMDTGEDAKGSGSGFAKEETGKKKKQQKILPIVFAYILLIWMLCVILYLLLELQRVIRMYVHQKKKEEAKKEKKMVHFYIKEMESILIAGKIKGNYSHPLELWPQIEKNFPGVKKEEYERILTLIQKARFGGRILKPYEMYTLECSIKHLKEALYQRQNLLGKIYLRYVKGI